jgi:hypothetical protein
VRAHADQPLVHLCAVGARCSFSATDEPIRDERTYKYLHVGAVDRGVRRDSTRREHRHIYHLTRYLHTNHPSPRQRRRPADHYLWHAGAGTTLTEIVAELKKKSLALPNLGQVTYQTAAGATQTGTHGSGARVGNVATFVAALELVTAAGQHLRIERSNGISVTDGRTVHDDAIFDAAVVGLGSFGVLTGLVLVVDDAWHMRETRSTHTFAAVAAQLPSWVRDNDHVEVLINPYTDLALRICRNDVNAYDVGRRGPLFQQNKSRSFVFCVSKRMKRSINAIFGWLRPCRKTAIPAVLDVMLRGQVDAMYTATSDKVLTNPVSEDVWMVTSETAIPIRGPLDVAYVEAIVATRDTIRAATTSDVYLNLPMNIRFVEADRFYLSANSKRSDSTITATCFIETPHKPTGAPDSFASQMRLIRAVEHDNIARREARPHPGKVQGRWSIATRTLGMYGAAPHVREAWTQWHAVWTRFMTDVVGLPNNKTFVSDFVQTWVDEAHGGIASSTSMPMPPGTA